MNVVFHGIVLHIMRYGDTSAIIKCFTENGLRSFLYKGARNKRNKSRFNRLHPMCRVEIVASDKGGEGLITLREVEAVTEPIQLDPYRMAMASFLAEVLMKALREEPSAERLMRFLNGLSDLIIEVHLEPSFLVQALNELAFFLGIQPEMSRGAFFDLRNGCFQDQLPDHADHLAGSEANMFYQAVEDVVQLQNHIQRNMALRCWLRYFQVQLDGFGTIKSLDVIETVFYD